jgi:hypothetical protein
LVRSLRVKWGRKRHGCSVPREPRCRSQETMDPVAEGICMYVPALVAYRRLSSCLPRIVELLGYQLERRMARRQGRSQMFKEQDRFPGPPQLPNLSGASQQSIRSHKPTESTFPRTALFPSQLNTWHHETLRISLGQSNAYKQANLERPIVEVLVPQSSSIRLCKPQALHSHSAIATTRTSTRSRVNCWEWKMV